MIAGPAFVDLDGNLSLTGAASILGGLDTAPLFDRGFVVIGNRAGHINGTVYDASGAVVTAFVNVAGVNGSVSQLSNGNLLIASEGAGGIQFKVLNDTTGATMVNTTLAAGGANASNADTSAFTGGTFAVAYEQTFSPTDSDVQIEIRSNTGALLRVIPIDAGPSKDTDIAIATAELVEGNRICATWTRTDTATGNTTLYYAIYTEQGATVMPPTILSNDFDVNRNPAVVSTGGGFAIAFEYQKFGNFNPKPSVDILMITMDLAGNTNGFRLVTNPNFGNDTIDDGSDDRDPTLAIGPDGNMLVGYRLGDGTPMFATLAMGQAIINEIGEFGAARAGAAAAWFGFGKVATFTVDAATGLAAQAWNGNRDVVGDGSDETYFGDDFLDIVNGGFGDDTAFGGGGNDEVKGDSGADTLHGGDGNDSVNGNGDTDEDDFASDTLFGDAGDDFLDGVGGGDHMEGGIGNDRYSVDDAGDVVVEFDGQGIDTVFSTLASYTLGSFVENLSLLSGAQGVGNGLANTITGNDSANQLSGLGGNDTLEGGADADTLTGGTGDDTYVNPTGDTIVEAAGAANGAHDTVRSGASFSIGTLLNVEDIVLTGNLKANAVGNTRANLLTGNENINILNGGGGPDVLSGLGGADTLQGGPGNDVYVNPVIGGAAGDTIVEVAGAAGGLNDRIRTQSSFNLNTVANVEDVTLVGGGKINAIGNNFDNILTGGTGANILNGGGGNDTLTGGAGADTMNGGGGADLFRFAIANTGADRIEGFSAAQDHFDLSGGTFSNRTEAGGNTTLTHAGGTIVVAGVIGLSLVQWNGLVIGGVRTAFAAHDYAAYTPGHHQYLGHFGAADFL